MHVDIIGAGIGGLTTSIALQKQGIGSHLYEQATELLPVGAGLLLAMNAMQVYEKLGLKIKIEKAGKVISALKINSPNLDPLSEINLQPFAKQYNVDAIAIHRGILQELLIESLDDPQIQLDHKLTSIVLQEEEAFLHFGNGKVINSNCLIGADGIHSIVRQSIFPETKIRSARQVCWRGIADFQLPEPYKNELNECWGSQERFGFVPLSDKKVYWFAVKQFQENPNEFSSSKLTDYFHYFHPLIVDIIEASPIEQINTAELFDLMPMNSWHQGSVCLLGDAVHAMTPNLGQGACQAIEDAYVLSKSLATEDMSKAFDAYQKLRLPKAEEVQKMSWRVGQMAHIKNPLMRGIRNQMMKLTPDSLYHARNEKLFRLAEV